MKQETTKYYCDCCKDEIQPESFSTISMQVNFRSEGGGCHQEVYKTKDVCDKCMLELGFDEVEVKHYNLPNQTSNLSSRFKDIIKKIYGQK